jgi:hypothetical protein
MTGENHFEAHNEHQRTGRRLDALLHRWPTALGAVVAALTVFDLGLNREFVAFLSALVIFMALIYVGAAAMNQRRAAWSIFLIGFVPLGVLRALDAAPILPALMLVAALGLLGLGLVRGAGHRAASFSLQAAGMLLFGALALAALALAPPVGAYLVAGALLAHSLWDALHLWRNRVVARSYAEFCAVIDLVLGVAILIVA